MDAHPGYDQGLSGVEAPDNLDLNRFAAVQVEILQCLHELCFGFEPCIPVVMDLCYNTCPPFLFSCHSIQ